MSKISILMVSKINTLYQQNINAKRRNHRQSVFSIITTRYSCTYTESKHRAKKLIKMVKVCKQM